MKVLLNKENVVFDFGEDIIFAKGGAKDGGPQECSKKEATHISNREKNTAVMNDGDITLVEVDKVSEGVEAHAYKYMDGEFVINEDFVPYKSPEERIAMLEDVINEMLLG